MSPTVAPPYCPQCHLRLALADTHKCSHCGTRLAKYPDGHLPAKQLANAKSNRCRKEVI